MLLPLTKVLLLLSQLLLLLLLLLSLLPLLSLLLLLLLTFPCTVFIYILWRKMHLIRPATNSQNVCLNAQ